MTYQLMTFYCKRCRSATPHEYDSERERARCTICADKSIRRQAELRFEAQSITDRHIAALDGYGNRGPK